MGLQGEEGVERLRRESRRSGQALRELVSVLEERSELEAAYAKGLRKLSTRLGKQTAEARGEVDAGWRAIERGMCEEAGVHKSLAQSLREDIVGPLRSLGEAQTKERRAAEAAVEKASKRLAEARGAASKAKRSLFALAKEEEKLEVQLEEDARRPFPLKSEKQTTKAREKLGKVKEGVASGERSYLAAVVEAERVREESGRAAQSVAWRLRALEAQRRGNVQTTLGRLRHLFSRLAPDLAKAAHPHLDAISALLNVDVNKETLAALIALLPDQPPTKSLLLSDFYVRRNFIQLACKRSRLWHNADLSESFVDVSNEVVLEGSHGLILYGVSVERRAFVSGFDRAGGLEVQLERSFGRNVEGASVCRRLFVKGEVVEDGGGGGDVDKGLAVTASRTNLPGAVVVAEHVKVGRDRWIRVLGEIGEEEGVGCSVGSPGSNVRLQLAQKLGPGAVGW